MLNLWKHTNQFEPGTTVRADHANFKLNGIEASFDQISEYMDKRVINLPASFTGNAYIPNKTLNNAIVWFNTSGDMDVYSMATFEQKVTDTASNAASALDSRNKAATSEANARQSELNAAASAEVAQGAAVTVAGGAFFAGTWNASTGSFPAAPVNGSSIWMASSNGTGATSAVQAGDFILWDLIALTYRHMPGVARVNSMAALVSNLESQLTYIESLAVAGNRQ